MYRHFSGLDDLDLNLESILNEELSFHSKEDKTVEKTRSMKREEKSGISIDEKIFSQRDVWKILEFSHKLVAEGASPVEETQGKL